MLLRDARNASSLSLYKAVDEACRHADTDRLSGALGQTASETDKQPMQVLRSLGLEKTISVSADSTCAERLASSQLVVASVKRDGRPVSGAIHEDSVTTPY